MPEFLRKHWAYLIGAVLLHVLFVGVLALIGIVARHLASPGFASYADRLDSPHGTWMTVALRRRVNPQRGFLIYFQCYKFVH